jgi:hypothetical protein
MGVAGWTWGRRTGCFTVALLMNPSRPFSNQWPRLEDTPSRGKFLKETLGFLEINLRSMAYFRKCVFAF